MKFYKKSYSDKLKHKGYAKRTVENYLKVLTSYEAYCIKNKNYTNEKELAYNYIQQLQKKGKGYKYIYRKTHPINLYYEFHNRTAPFHYLKVKRVEKVIFKHYHSKEELQEIYNNYPETTVKERRNKVLLGFFIYQGITSKEIKYIMIDDVDLTSYTIFLQGDGRSNSRKLKLDIQQILLLHNFIKEDRNKIVKNSFNKQLITTSRSKNDLHGITRTMVLQLRKKYKKFVSFNHIRGSVISNWLKDYDLRKVQYFSGHKCILSTERYIVTDVSQLKKSIEKHFPLEDF